METDDFLPIYSLAEWHYCPRSAFLSWFGAEREDRVSAAYQTMREAHAVSDTARRRDKNRCRIETSVHLIHRELRITGRADAVEWQDDVPAPVEYKNCGAEPARHVIAQLTLQAVCLHDMHGVCAPFGFVFCTGSRRRIRVGLDETTTAWVLSGVDSFRTGLRLGLGGFERRKQEGCRGCIYRACCWPEEWPHV